MTSIASSPGKIILFGEHFVVYGIKAILGSIDKRIKVSSSKIDEKFIKIESELGNETFPTSVIIENIESPLKPFIFLSKKMIDEFNYDGGVLVKIDSEIPLGVGLGSSSACCVAGAGSISGLFTKLSRDQILNLAIEAEKTIFKNTSGADCTVCTYGGIIEYGKDSGFRQISSKQGFNLVIANSMIPHSTDVIVANVKNFKENNEELFSSLCEKESKLIQKVNEAFQKNDLHTIGKCMKENQNFLEQIGVSTNKLRTMIEIAEKTTFGAKITGAGGGGCIIAITDELSIADTVENFKVENYECFSAKIDNKGLETF